MNAARERARYWAFRGRDVVLVLVEDVLEYALDLHDKVTGRDKLTQRAREKFATNATTHDRPPGHPHP